MCRRTLRAVSRSSDPGAAASCHLVAMPPRAPAAKVAAVAAAAAETVPASKRPRTSEVKSAEPLKKPDVDDFEDFAGSRAVMKRIIPWVNQELLSNAMVKTAVKEAIGRSGAAERRGLSGILPLALAKSETSTEQTSYKEPWQPDHCSMSCKKTGLYEAGGCLFWLDPEVSAIRS